MKPVKFSNPELNSLVDYLEDKKIKFAVQDNKENNEQKIIAITISKRGKFFYANGIIISGNMVNPINKIYKNNN